MKKNIKTGDIVVTSDICNWPLYTIAGQSAKDVRDFINGNNDNIYVICLPTHVDDNKNVISDCEFIKIPMDKIHLIVGKAPKIATDFDNTICNIIKSNSGLDKYEILPLEDSDCTTLLFDKIWDCPKLYSQFEHVVYRNMDKETAMYIYNRILSINSKELQSRFNLNFGTFCFIKSRLKDMME